MPKVYIDENFSEWLAKGLNILEKPNDDDITVYSIKEEFGEGAQDEVWLAAIGKVNGIVITQDLNINRTRHLKELYLESGVGVFFFKPPSKKGFSYWEMVLQIITRWTDIKSKIKKTSHPFAYRSTVRKTEFDLLN